MRNNKEQFIHVYMHIVHIEVRFISPSTIPIMKADIDLQPQRIYSVPG